ncbi:2-amino-4-hydroxy-6-hydroxymethyldihydropteridine diphosphokinase [Sphingomonas montana]|uniref:2-amino-4-hydroxy-6- hydroxymethyldihydropteridine diphosphokinase n=1 Tax=Sphingomonas montana TaxID=1843236 RepID=UPI00096F7CBA|nr:2-amino-4-hydroxy-6-hydroxymethyldihydropteridine diphosphokinase [Sphingomonas montana]
MTGPVFRYALALGGNRRTRYGGPRATLAAACAALSAAGIAIDRMSPMFATPAMGPAGRGFANAAILVSTPLLPEQLLALLKRIEQDFGRRRGRRWGPRPLDLDILLWSGGAWPPAPRRAAAGRLQVPHAGLAARRFVLDPLVRIAPRWALPATRRTIAQLHARAKG